jgi:glycosyltransferase involved in cell wall biosynthesis
LIPGGVYLGNFKPAVVMSQNLLPFEWRELSRFSWSVKGLKLLILFFIQSFSFRNADGLIFLTSYSKSVILRVVKSFQKESIVIPHGINPQFLMEPRKQINISEFNEKKTFRILYVSIIDLYKHQDKVIQAVSLLRSEGFPVSLDLVGPFYQPAYIKMKFLLDDVLNKSNWANYHGSVPYNELRNYYHSADLAIFASSCENLPNILIEKMAAGLPVACSRMGPMPEVLCDAGLYFNPEDHIDIANVLRKYLLSSELRWEKARASYDLSKKYSWGYSAKKTLDFVIKIADISNLKTK